MIGFSHGNTFTDANVRAGLGMMVTPGGAGNLIFETGAGGAQAERMRINSTGNVGIGTTSPQRRLDLGTTAGGMTFGDDVTADSERGIYWHSGAGTTGYGIFRQALGGSWSPPYAQLNIVWQTGIVLDPGASSTKSYVQINQGGLNIGAATAPPTHGLLVSGNVGIGTASPSYALDIGTSPANTNGSKVGFRSSTDEAALALFGPTGNKALYAGYVSSAGDYAQSCIRQRKFCRKATYFTSIWKQC